MGNIRYAIFLFVIVFARPASGGDANTPRLEKLYRTFIAPCCWSKNLMEHNSQVAAEMRGKIDLMVQAGRSDDEIKSVFVARVWRESSGASRGRSQSVAFLDACGGGRRRVYGRLPLPEEFEKVRQFAAGHVALG